MIALIRPNSAVPLAERLPTVRGRVTANAPLSAITWFAVGGPAEVLVRPADEDDLATLLAGLPPEVPVTVIGVGSNLLVRDGGVPGVVLRLGKGFAGISTEGLEVRAGAAALDLNIALTAAEAGIAGLEFLSGVPGTLGGALRMNAGAYGGDTAQVLVEARALDRTGTPQTATLTEMGLTYRHSKAPADWIFTRATLRGTNADPKSIGARLAEIRTNRETAQPIRAKTGGSTFKNPLGQKAWELIDKAGCRGLRLGGAQVSEKHTNFLINTGTATAAEIEALGEEVRRRVLETSGVTLEWEIKRIGLTAGEAA
jgi:UDP-N-acetylmuramate dehydrogenase